MTREGFCGKQELPKIRSENAERKRSYVKARISRASYRKLRRWLDRRDHLEIGTGGTPEDPEIWVVNETRIRATAHSRALFGHPERGKHALKR